MKVHFTVPGYRGEPDKHREMAVIPREGDTVFFDGTSYRVHGVHWYPDGDEGSEEFVYIVLRP